MQRTRTTYAMPRSFLPTMEIFRKVPAEALREIETRMIERKYARQESIHQEGDPAEKVWFVKEGHVKAMAHAAGGRCQTLCMVGAGNMFGSCCALDGGSYPCHAVAETDTTVVSFPRTDFVALLEKYPQIGAALAMQISGRLRRSKETQAFDQETVERRVLHVLLELVEEFGNTIPLTRREIAEMVGTTVETSIRTFGRLEEEGLVSTARGRIIVRDVKEMAQRLDAA
ncbi:MAG TPA: Crp/Fnr family transcriptional regulator [bacterium]|nr:Crp/Fnr family transcriptional regulator [bacterium]